MCGQVRHFARSFEIAQAAGNYIRRLVGPDADEQLTSTRVRQNINATTVLSGVAVFSSTIGAVGNFSSLSF